MKRLIFLLALFSLPAHAIDLEFVNHTGADMRISELNDKCLGPIITEKSPVYIKNGGSYTVKNITAVVHTYTICGSGLCSSSAIGVKAAPKYVFEAVLKDGMIDGNATPDHWTGGNFECK